MFRSNHTILFGFALLSELRKTLQKQEEETKQREKNIDELQNKNESLKSDLTKADKERKELAHKVGAGVIMDQSVLSSDKQKVYPVHFVFHPDNSPTTI